MNKGFVICADVIAWYGNTIVLVERLEQNRGLALPGGKHDEGELLSHTAMREMREETGLQIVIESVLGTYAEEDRDPRGHYISTVFIGNAHGELLDEMGKTHVITLTQQEIYDRKDDFLFDHFKILKEYFTLMGSVECELKSYS